MHVAIIASNALPITNKTRKGTELFVKNYVDSFETYKKDTAIELTVFASGDSDFPVSIESIEAVATNNDLTIPSDKLIIFELALIAKAFSQQDKFDLYHIHIGSGDIVLPFAQFVKKPILITPHYTADFAYMKRYFNLFTSLSHVSYVAISEAQKRVLPTVSYRATIPHGIQPDDFPFHPLGGDKLFWAARALPEKGLTDVLSVGQQTKYPLSLCAILKPESEPWFTQTILPTIQSLSHCTLATDKTRTQLVTEYQTSKLFLFPIHWDEPFGLVLIESLSCGTPVVAYARGAVPEIIKDGVTGFIVNESAEKKAGDFSIKQTGIAGLVEAVERIYAMPEAEYKAMRQACRDDAVSRFSMERMVNDYLNLYKQLIK